MKREDRERCKEAFEAYPSKVQAWILLLSSLYTQEHCEIVRCCLDGKKSGMAPSVSANTLSTIIHWVTGIPNDVQLMFAMRAPKVQRTINSTLKQERFEWEKVPRGIKSDYVWPKEEDV